MIKLTESYSFRMRPMTKRDAFAFDGCSKLPSGSGLVISSSEYKVDIFLSGYKGASVEVLMFWTDKSGNTMIWNKGFEGWTNQSENEAMKLVRSIIKSFTSESLSAYEIADKYDLTNL